MREHPSLDIVSSYGSELAGKRIVLCITGSVAAYKSIELARLLMRHGADVICVASKAATDLIKPSYFKWATGNQVITKLTGDLEHIRVADYKRSDLIIVYPCTANTLGKLAHGIDDTPIATVLSVGFGSKIPIIISLAMHKAMYENPAVKRNIGFLTGKVSFIDPQILEGKAKAAEPEQVLEFVLGKFGASPIFQGKKVLITAGPTVEHIDPIRILTNLSSGKTGILLTQEFLKAGAKVTLIYGHGKEPSPKGARVLKVETGREMLEAVRNEMRKRYDMVILVAAVSDYTIERPSRTKIKSEADKVVLNLKKIPKIINEIRRIQKDIFLVGFKAETDVSRKALIKSSLKKLTESGADMIVANDVGRRYKKDPNKNNVIIVDSEGDFESGWKTKEKITKFVFNHIRKRFEKKSFL